MLAGRKPGRQWVLSVTGWCHGHPIPKFGRFLARATWRRSQKFPWRYESCRDWRRVSLALLWPPMHRVAGWQWAPTGHFLNCVTSFLENIDKTPGNADDSLI